MRRFAIVFAGLASAALASPVMVVQTNLASDIPGLAPVTDPNLKNSWGMGASATSPVWIGDNGTGTSVLYSSAGVKQGLTVTIPGDGTVTGVLFSNVSGSFNSDTFLFDSEDGTVSGWRGALGTNAETLQTANSANVYKGLAGATIGGNEYAYLANFRSGNIDVLKGNNAAPNLTGNFTDPNLPSGYAPFDVQNLNGVLYVTYAVQDPTKHDDVAGPGNGIVDAFDVQGNLIGRIATNGPLDSPWGLALAPAGWGSIAGDLLVGNFGDGRINVYTTSGQFVQTLLDSSGNQLMIDGLWALRPNIQGNTPNTVFFTAGPNDEADGLFGELNLSPEPGTWAFAIGSLAALWMARRRRSR